MTELTNEEKCMIHMALLGVHLNLMDEETIEDKELESFANKIKEIMEKLQYEKKISFAHISRKEKI